MLTHKQRILMAMRGEMPDVLPFVPRIDLWYNANSIAGTLPEKHKGRSKDEIARSEGWALHKVIADFLRQRNPEDTVHRAIGVYPSLKEMPCKCRFSGDTEINVKRENGKIQVEYHTPVGTVTTTTIYTEEMRQAGASLTWIEEHPIKKLEDYRVLGYIFENLEVIPNFDNYAEWQREIGDDGVAVAVMPGAAASPMHHIQKHLMAATEFFLHYHDYQKEIRALAESLENYYNQMLKILADSTAEVVLWGGNFDDMITYPSYFEKEMLPWIRKVSDTFRAKGKILLCHCDGENLGLMDLIRDSGMDVAESVTPYPMTKVPIEEYYRRWSDKLTIFGGIPETLLVAETATQKEFETYLDNLFKAVAPGRRFIVGIADTVPPKADFERLVRIGERVEKEGRLPLEGGGARPLSEQTIAKAAERVTQKPIEDKIFKEIQSDVLAGKHVEIKEHVQHLLDKGSNANDILERGMISAMEVISEQFKTGDVFIPEVLLSARAMNEALLVLEPYLIRKDKEASGRILIGTVQGDMHDIGKNMVITLLRGVGFEIRDMGVNVPTEKIVAEVREYQPHVLGLSALLTTTMPMMKNVIDTLAAANMRGAVKVIVGGAPVNEKFATDIGADGYAHDAGEAVSVVKGLIKRHES